MKKAKLMSITVSVDRQTVEIPVSKLKLTEDGFEYDDLFVPISAQLSVQGESHERAGE